VREVSIIGIGQVAVNEHWDKSIRELGAEATLAAMRSAGVEMVDALYVGNMLSGEIAGQEHVATLIADFAGLRGIEAARIEAACASGAAALRMGILAVASGLAETVAVCGVEKMTDSLAEDVTTALASAADAEFEVSQGVSFVSLNALLMRRYMYEYKVEHSAFANFAVNAHRNAMHNPNAMFHLAVTEEAFNRSRMIADPVGLLDSAPICDGAAAVILGPTARAKEFSEKPIHIRASAIATDSLAIHDRSDPLFLRAAYASAQKAYAQARVSPSDIQLFELHDAFTIMSALSLEACGFAARGQGARLAQAGEIMLGGRLPISTMGGLKGRGHPVGATGIYQIVELAQQLRGEAGKNQLKNCQLGMAQNIGGSGATVVTHILEML
jgi:acetyl-CoA C-acetyltransferase